MMISYMCSSLFCILIVNVHSKGIISSTTSLQRLMKQERFVIEQLLEANKKADRQGLTDVKNEITRYIKSYLELFQKGKTEKNISYHPVDAFHFIKLITLEFLNLELGLAKAKKTINGMLEALTLYRSSNNYPDLQEMEKTAASLARLREVYQIPLKIFIEGKLQFNNHTDLFQSSKKLNALDCFIIGAGAARYKIVKEGLVFLEAAKRMRQQGDHSAYEEEIDTAYKSAKPRADEPYYYAYTEEAKALCRGETIKETLKNANLICRYVDRGNPYLLLGPMKLEEKSKDPPIMVFHDFAFDSELERLKRFASDNLTPSVIQTDELDVQDTAGFERTSETAWLFDFQDYDFAYRMSRRIDEATGLNAGTHTDTPYAAEPYQIVNYGIAGVYAVHTDNLQGETFDWVRHGGDRIATLLIYLNDVGLGGATVFPKAGVTINPKRGSAALWYNVLRSGTPNDRTQHSGCPVLYGSKWISNKWIMLYGQMFRKKCGLGQFDNFDLL